MAICRTFIDQLRSGSARGSSNGSTAHTASCRPTRANYHTGWHWCVFDLIPWESGGSLTIQVMPIDEYEKARLLPIRSPRLRLKLIVHWVESLRSSWW